MNSGEIGKHQSNAFWHGFCGGFGFGLVLVGAAFLVIETRIESLMGLLLLLWGLTSSPLGIVFTLTGAASLAMGIGAEVYEKKKIHFALLEWFRERIKTSTIISVILLVLLVSVGITWIGTEATLYKTKGKYEHLKTLYDELNAMTYYIVAGKLKVTDLRTDGFEFICGNVTNISEKPVEDIYVLVILRNPDGTVDFSPFACAKIESLTAGETKGFEIRAFQKEPQTFEILLIY